MITTIYMTPSNRMVRVGFGKYEGRWFARIDLWWIGFRLSSRAGAHLSSVDAIVDDLMSTLSSGDKDFILSGQRDFGSIGRHIRNTYGLWDAAHPLTSNWAAYPEARNIIDGVDYSTDHPDNLSATILAALRKRLTS